MGGASVKIAVVGYPAWSDADRDRVEGIRRRHDPAKAAMIAAHVTFVFPTGLLNEDAVLAHLHDRLRGDAPIEFTLSAAEPAVDDAMGEHLVFLLPGHGRVALTALHDRLYTGALAPALRPDLPYCPHITVARFADAAGAAALANDIRRDGLSIAGRIEAVTVLRCTADSIRPVATLPFTG
ncbi:2'-5' RNA ligase [Inquilinus ginsengisoli]|uniref:2'-5' RNA ligase n=2 Tax=Inquilinus TaxID=171673 RepID=A0ABU1JTP5_9PROT|nr:2'-5' RNA ligase family protein [Inquilinus ginsengisoli]MDR6291977.1 2'-5' RNA ligase [Inquilinus ginsengisoli]